ncbi:hypothetical protein [Nocardiopsis ganjiahuensis]|uniref:hypothetical protein n=1 Tax=Nocardiopsis ganjiahuensis TaxID=239984 RepID=UPI00036DD4A2|nr:hypothetical protein [Nocardiopsis ganjiahuensis]
MVNASPKTAAGGGGVPVPWVGAALASLMALAALGVAGALWAELPEMVPNGRVGLDGEPALTPRWLFVTAMPGVTLLLVAVMLVGPRAGVRFQRALRLPVPWPGRGARRSMDLFLVLMGAFLLATHVVMLRSEAGRALPLSTEHLVVLLVAGFMAGVGLLVSLLRSGDGHDTVAARWWDRARRPVGVGLALVGVATGLVGFLVPGTLWAVLMGVLMMPVILLGCVFPFIGKQEWMHRTRSSE